MVDLLFQTLTRMKRFDSVENINLDVYNDEIKIVDSEGTLILSSNRTIYPGVADNIVHFNYINSSRGYNYGDPGFDATYSLKKKYKEIKQSAINVAKDLHLLLNLYYKLPSNPPMRDKSVFSRKELYRRALIDQLQSQQNQSEFLFFRGAQRVELNQDQSNECLEEQDKVLIKVQESSQHSIDSFTDRFRIIAKNLAENIYNSVNREINEQVSKELSRRRELRFHVALFKAYICLQAFCSLNLSRGQGETTKSQAKTLVLKFFPQISLPNMALMLQRAPRIYRLFLLAHGDWRILDSFEELTPSFFKSSMNSAENFDIWVNVVKSGLIVAHEDGAALHENGKQIMKAAKLNIIKSYFNGVVEEDSIIIDDDE